MNRKLRKHKFAEDNIDKLHKNILGKLGDPIIPFHSIVTKDMVKQLYEMAEEEMRCYIMESGKIISDTAIESWLWEYTYNDTKMYISRVIGRFAGHTPEQQTVYDSINMEQMLEESRIRRDELWEQLYSTNLLRND